MNAKILLKACPRCRGDLYGGIDDEFSCLQCGYELTASTMTRPVETVSTEAKKPAVKAA